MSQSHVTLFPPQALTLSGHLQPLSSVCTSCPNTKKPQFILLLFYKASFHNLGSRYLGNMPFSTQVLDQQLQLAWEACSPLVLTKLEARYSWLGVLGCGNILFKCVPGIPCLQILGHNVNPIYISSLHP